MNLGNAQKLHQERNSFLNRIRQALIADKDLRWNQRDVVNTIVDYIAAHSNKDVTEQDSNPDHDFPPITIKKPAHYAAMIESSPGSGKTRIMGFIAKHAAHLNGANPGHKAKNPIKVLLLTPRLNLNRQTLSAFDEELGIKDKDVALFDGTQTIKEKQRAKDAPVLIATYQSLGKMIKDGVVSLDHTSQNYRGMVLMDEAHEMVSFQEKPKGSLEEVSIESFVNNHQITLLFTGTDDGVSQRHFNCKVPTIYSKRLVKAHNQGLTCDPIHPGLVDVSLKEHIARNEENVAELIDNFSGHEGVIQRAVQVQLMNKHPEMGELSKYKSLFFVNGVEAGRNGMQYFNAMANARNLINPRTGKPLEAAHIHADTPSGDRTKIIADYKSGKIAAIFNDSIITFGFDDIETAVVHNIKMHDRKGGSKALAAMEQIFTRGTRICKDFSNMIALDGNPYGLDKQALLLTYRPVDAANKPHDVLTSADLLSGLRMNHKARRIRPTARKSGDKDNCGVIKEFKLSADDLELHCDFSVQQILEETRKRLEEERRNEERIKAVSVEKTNQWIGKIELMRRFSITNENREFGKQWNKLQADFRNNPEATQEKYPHISFAITMPRNMFVVSLEDSDKLANTFGIKSRDPKCEYDKNGAACELGRSPATEIFKNSWEQLVSSYYKNSDEPVQIGEISIDPLIKRNRSLVITKSGLQALGEAIQKIEALKKAKKLEFVSLGEISNQNAGLSRQRLTPIWNEIIQAYMKACNNEPVDQKVLDVTVSGKTFTTRYDHRTNSISISLAHQDQLLEMSGYHKEFYKEKDKWVRARDFCKYFGVSDKQSGFKGLWQGLTDGYDKMREDSKTIVQTITVNDIDVRMCKISTAAKDSYYIHLDDALKLAASDDIKRQYNIRPATIDPQNTAIAQSDGPAKQIKGRKSG